MGLWDISPAAIFDTWKISYITEVILPKDLNCCGSYKKYVII